MGSKIPWRSLLLLAFLVGTTVAAETDKNLCRECRQIVSLVSRFNSSIDQQQAANIFESFCEQYYPPSTDYQQGPCPVFVQGLIYVIRNTNPVTHCDEINACGPSQPSDDIYQYLESSNSNGSAQKDEQAVCDYCQNLVDHLKAILSDPETVRKVREQSEAFCTYLKVLDLEKECKSAIDKYLDYAEKLIQNVNSRDYCTSIRMCPLQSRKTIKLPTLASFNNFGIETSVSIGPKPVADKSSSVSKGKNGPGCTLCKTVVKEMFHFIRENKTEENIIYNLDRVCKIVYPSEPKLGECKEMVKAYTREFVQLLVDETDPEVICMLLEQCVYSKTDDAANKQTEMDQVRFSITPNDARHSLSQLITALDPSIPVQSLRSCVECKMFIKFLRDKLNDPKSQEVLKQWLLDNLCKELPEDSLIKSCSSMVESYSDVFFKAVVGDLNPQAACVELGVCNARSVMMQALSIGEQPKTQIRPRIVARRRGSQRMVKSKERGCNQCMSVVSLVDEYLATQPADSMSNLSKVCDNADNPALTKGDCVYMIKRHGTDMVQLIPTMESPRHLCKGLAMC